MTISCHSAPPGTVLTSAVYLLHGGVLSKGSSPPRLLATMPGGIAVFCPIELNVKHGLTSIWGRERLSDRSDLSIGSATAALFRAFLSLGPVACREGLRQSKRELASSWIPLCLAGRSTGSFFTFDWLSYFVPQFVVDRCTDRLFVLSVIIVQRLFCLLSTPVASIGEVCDITVARFNHERDVTSDFRIRFMRYYITLLLCCYKCIIIFSNICVRSRNLSAIIELTTVLLYVK